jgi:putative flavoprotein involved in K+ transport
MAYFLARQGRRFVILERADSIGAAWRERWDSLTLFTPRRYNSLPGLVFPGDPEGYPNRDEVIAYLEQYAQTFDLPIELDSEVRRLMATDGRFELEVDGSSIGADEVVVATGPFQRPHVPELAGRLAPDVFQAHATAYRNPEAVPKRTVLVVGGGNTGFQIAKELSATHDVQLSVGSRQMPLPQRLLGRDLFWWLTKTRLLRTTVDSRRGRRMRERETLNRVSSPGPGSALRRQPEAPRGRRLRPNDQLRGRDRARGRRRGLGDRLPPRLLLDRPSRGR